MTNVSAQLVAKDTCILDAQVIAEDRIADFGEACPQVSVLLKERERIANPNATLPVPFPLRSPAHP